MAPLRVVTYYCWGCKEPTEHTVEDPLWIECRVCGANTPRPEVLPEETPEGKEILGLVDKLGEAAGVRREDD